MTAQPNVVGAPAPSVLRMAGPLVISFWMRAAFTFVDTIYAAAIGDEAVAAIGLSVPFEFLMIAIWVGLSTGLTSGLSRSMGAHQGAKIQQYLRLSWRLVVGASVLFMLLGIAIWILAPHLPLEPSVSRSFQIYGSVLIGGSALTTFWSVIPDSLVKAHHDTRATMWAGIWSNVINVVLNTIFLFVFHWGIFGIALSTVLGRIGGLWYAMIQSARHEKRRKEAGEDLLIDLDPSPSRTILSLAVPSAFTFALMAGETAVVNALLATLRNPTEAIAAYSIFYRVLLFALNPILAIGVAMLPYAARRLGEGDGEGVRRGLRQAALATGLYSAVIVAPSLLIGADWLAEWLAESPLTRDYTAVALRFVPLMCVVGAPFLLCRPVFEAMQRGMPGLVIAAFRYVVLTVPCAWGGIRLARELGVPELYGLLVGLLAAAALSSAIFLLWLRTALPAISSRAQLETRPIGSAPA